MSENTSLDDILNDEPQTEAPQAEVQPEAEAPEELSASKAQRQKLAEDEQSDAPARDEKGRFAPKGEKQPEAEEAPAAEAPPAPQDETGQIPIAALKDERSKRQALEAELQQLRQQFQAMQQPQTPQVAPDRWEDPEGYDRWLMGQVTAAAEQRAIEAFTYQRIASDAAQFKADKPDYDQVIGVFGQMANVNPGLIEQMKLSPNPAKYAYETAKLQQEIMQHGGLEGLIEARLKAREAEALKAVEQQLPQSTPPTISGDRSVGQRTAQPWAGPTPLGDILS